MDPLTDVLTSMRVESVMYGRLEATAPWGLSFDDSAHAKFGMVLRGSCWLATDELPEPVLLSAGDCYLLPRGNPHTLRDDPRTGTRRFAELLGDTPCCGLEFGGGGTPTTIVGGRFTFDGPSSRFLTELLPPIIHVEVNDPQTLALQTTLQLLASEIALPGPGSQVVVNRLADTILVQVMRAHLSSPDCSNNGWLRAISDPSIGPALKSMHGRIEHQWTVAELASSAGMSRSAFALRFKEIAGESPLEYLTKWRMYRAGRLLRDGDRKLLEVSNMVGYGSDGAFSKTFKRVYGMTPGEYRRNGITRPGGDGVEERQSQIATA